MTLIYYFSKSSRGARNLPQRSMTGRAKAGFARRSEVGCGEARAAASRLPALCRHAGGLAAIAALGPACAGDPPADGRETSILLAIDNAPGADVPDELQITVRDEVSVIFDGERLPRAGNLAPESSGHLGTVRIVVGEVQGDVQIDLRGIRRGAPVSKGGGKVRTKRNGEVRATIVVAKIAVETDGPPSPPKDHKDASAG